MCTRDDITKAILDIMPINNGYKTVKDKDYHIQSIRSSYIVEQLGGMKMQDSSLFKRSVLALLDLGNSEEDILSEVRKIRSNKLFTD